MFIKLYKYKIRSENFEKWRENNDAANHVYREHGAKRLERMVKKNEDMTKVMELGYYESEDEFKRIAALVDQDERIKMLFSEFKKLVIGDIIEEDYETV